MAEYARDARANSRARSPAPGRGRSSALPLPGEDRGGRRGRDLPGDHGMRRRHLAAGGAEAAMSVVGRQLAMAAAISGWSAALAAAAPPEPRSRLRAGPGRGRVLPGPG